MSTLPAPPTPPLPGRTRDIVYGVWAWLSVLLGAVITAWVVVGEAAPWMLALSLGLNYIGAACGFLAKNNINT